MSNALSILFLKIIYKLRCEKPFCTCIWQEKKVRDFCALWRSLTLMLCRYLSGFNRYCWTSLMNCLLSHWKTIFLSLPHFLDFNNNYKKKNRTKREILEIVCTYTTKIIDNIDKIRQHAIKLKTRLRCEKSYVNYHKYAEL